MSKPIAIYLFVKSFLTSSNLYKISKRKNLFGTDNGIPHLCTQKDEFTLGCDEIVQSAYNAIEKYNCPKFQKDYHVLKIDSKSNGMLYKQPSIANHLSTAGLFSLYKKDLIYENKGSDVTSIRAQKAMLDNSDFTPFCKKAAKRTYSSQDNQLLRKSLNITNTTTVNEDRNAKIYCVDKLETPKKDTADIKTAIIKNCLNSTGPGTSLKQEYINSPTIYKTTSLNEPFFQSTLSLLKNLLYYRFNLAIFFNTLFSHVNMPEKHSTAPKIGLKNAIMIEFIKKSIEFVENKNGSIEIEISVAEEKDIEALKVLEKVLIKESIITANVTALSKSKEYKAITEHNKKYNRAINTSIRNSHFGYLYLFLQDIFRNKIPISKCYYSFNALVMSLYNTSLTINKVLDQSTQEHLINISSFKIQECECTYEIKQYFLFHWAFCWLSYFSRRVSLPKKPTSFVNVRHTIRSCPKEFFLQVILLVHLVINYKDTTVSMKDLDNSFILSMKAIIYKLFSTNVNGQEKTFLESTLQDFFIYIFNIANHKAYYSNSIFHTRICKPPKKTMIYLINLFLYCKRYLKKYLIWQKKLIAEQIAFN